MKLYLSSYYLGDDAARYAALFSTNKRVAIIMNAADIYGPAEHQQRLDAEITALHKIGLIGDELDLRDYFTDGSARLADVLQQYGGVWVMGGNSFVLRRAMRQSGFDSVAPKMIRANQLVYGGFSAGSVIATPSLHGIELVDDPAAVPDGYYPAVIWEGYGLYDKFIAPHYKSDHPESAAIDEVVAYFEQEHMPYTTLHDGEAIIIDE